MEKLDIEMIVDAEGNVKAIEERWSDKLRRHRDQMTRDLKDQHEKKERLHHLRRRQLEMYAEMNEALDEEIAHQVEYEKQKPRRRESIYERGGKARGRFPMRGGWEESGGRMRGRGPLRGRGTHRRNIAWEVDSQSTCDELIEERRSRKEEPSVPGWFWSFKF